MQSESKVMLFLRRLGFESLAWKMRRLFCPVDPAALVLEVGSGGNPYFRSNVLLDAYVETRERHWVPLVTDRPTVLGFVENLPFKDQSFDFVIASHVLEHSHDPDKFIAELQRVARAGYIEVPDAFMERLNPYRDHRLEITVREDRLRVKKKEQWQSDPSLVDLYEDRVKVILTKETMRRHPFAFHVRYYWSGKVDYFVTNPECNADWEAPVANESKIQAESASACYRRLAQKVVTWLLAQRRRNSKLDLFSMLRCPTCGSGDTYHDSTTVVCRVCESVYDIRDGVPLMCAKTDEIVGVG